jgi:hypothetical protein
MTGESVPELAATLIQDKRHCGSLVYKPYLMK